MLSLEGRTRSNTIYAVRAPAASLARPAASRGDAPAASTRTGELLLINPPEEEENTGTPLTRWHTLRRSHICLSSRHPTKKRAACCVGIHLSLRVRDT